MGNSLTVDNRTFNQIKLVYYFAGSEEKSKKVDIKPASKTRCFTRFKCSGTLIVSIDNKAFRAVQLNESIQINQLEKGLIIIDTDSCVNNWELDTMKYKIKVERNLNWNRIGDNDKDRNAANKWIKEMNIMTSVLGTVVGNYLGCSLITDKVADKLLGKYLSDLLVNCMTVSEIKSKRPKDFNSLENIKRINYQLIGINRAINFDYSYLKEDGEFDNAEKFKFLHKQLMKITNPDIMIYLENCGLEEAFPVYVSASYLALEIFEDIRQLNKYQISKLENNYMKTFEENIKNMWDNIIEKISNNCSVKTKGFFYKTATFLYEDQFIYEVQGVFKSRVEKEILGIKNAFIKNRKYQTGCLFDQLNNEVRNYGETSDKKND